MKTKVTKIKPRIRKTRKTRAQKKTGVHIQIDEWIYKKISKLALKEGRNKRWYIIKALVEFLVRYDREQKLK